MLYRVNGEKFRPLRWVEEDGAHAAVEPQSWQEALHLPGVGRSVVNFHLHAVVALHAFPMAAGDKQLAVQRHQAAVLVEHVEELDLRRGQRGNEDQVNAGKKNSTLTDAIVARADVWTNLLPHVFLWIVRVDLLCVVSHQINSSIHADGARGGQILGDKG